MPVQRGPVITVPDIRIRASREQAPYDVDGIVLLQGDVQWRPGHVILCARLGARVPSSGSCTA